MGTLAYGLDNFTYSLNNLIPTLGNIPYSSATAYKDAFTLFDKDNSANISISELQDVMHSLGWTPTQPELSHILNEIDVDHNGTIEFEEFLHLMSHKGASRRSEEDDSELYEMFKVFDKDGNGTISTEELGAVLREMGEKLTDEEVKEMITEADLNGDMVLNFEEFKRMFGDRD